jgi:putative hemolysin
MDLLPASVAGLPDWLLRPLATVAGRALALRECERLLHANRDARTLGEWARGVLRELDIGCEFGGVAFDAAIPRDGPVLIVCNHPFGVVDALALFSIRERLRADLRFVGQGIWQRIPQLAPELLPLRPSSGKAFQPENARTLRSALHWVRSGHALAMFPAPTVAHWQWRTRRVEDPPWSEFPGAVVAASGATVVPLHCGGRNGLVFQVASALCPSLRHALLLRELLARRGGSVRMIVGRGVEAREFGDGAGAAEITAGIRRHVEELSRPAEDLVRH